MGVLAITERRRSNRRSNPTNPLPEPFVEGGRVVVTHSIKGADRDITSPSAPSHPFGSADLRILRAWIAAEIAHPGNAAAIRAAIETAVSQSAEGAAREVLGQHYHQVPAAIRPLLGRPAGEGLKRLLGDWSKPADGSPSVFEPGLAGLTERQARAYWLKIRGWSSSAIAQEMTPPNRRHDRTLWISVQTVYNHTHAAKLKVLEAFGLAEREGDDDWPDEGGA